MKSMFTLALLAFSTLTFAMPNYFFTILKPKLSVYGGVCNGTESIGGVHNCKKGDWLITIDRYNSCGERGCTELFVSPNFTAKLVRLNVPIASMYRFYSIVPTMKASATDVKFMKNYELRLDIVKDVFELVSVK